MRTVDRGVSCSSRGTSGSWGSTWGWGEGGAAGGEGYLQKLWAAATEEGLAAMRVTGRRREIGGEGEAAETATGRRNQRRRADGGWLAGIFGRARGVSPRIRP